MLGTTPNSSQGNLFYPQLKNIINLNHPLCQLAAEIDWAMFEDTFSHYYSNKGRPSHPIRLMVGLLIIKQLDGLGDETIVAKWVENPYYQYFCGMDVFQWKRPIDPSDLVYFRNRIGKAGAELILKSSVQIHGQQAEEEEVLVDTTVQTKAITYPTDAKLHKRIIEYGWSIADEEEIKLRQSYKRTVKELMKSQYNSQHPRRAKSAKKGLKRLRTITGRLLRDIVRKLPEDRLSFYAPLLQRFEHIMNQKRGDSDKIYSLHATEVACIAKGKAFPKYEFGSKVALVQTKMSGIIVSAQNFQGNPHDSHTLLDTFLQYNRITDGLPKVAIVDRGFRGANKVLGVDILKPDKPTKGKSAYQKAKARKRFRRRASIEPVIGHLKDRFKLKRNWLKGTKGDQINVSLAAAAFNFKKWMNLREEILFAWIKYSVLRLYFSLGYGNTTLVIKYAA
ncbi:MAG: IS5 family transposase [Bacteroidota bacterium]